jgi:hypothetical protein
MDIRNMAVMMGSVAVVVQRKRIKNGCKITHIIIAIWWME